MTASGVEVEERRPIDLISEAATYLLLVIKGQRNGQAQDSEYKFRACEEGISERAQSTKENEPQPPWPSLIGDVGKLLEPGEDDRALNFLKLMP